MNCVSGALYGETREQATLFSTENIIETYFAVAGPEAGISDRVNFACRELTAYRSRLQQFRDEVRILQQGSIDANPETLWRTVLLHDLRASYPRENARTKLRSVQQQYCLFAAECRNAQNSPFPGLARRARSSARDRSQGAPVPQAITARDGATFASRSSLNVGSESHPSF